MVMQDALHGEGNAKRGGNATNPIPVRERPYMDNYFDWLDMIADVQQGNHDDSETYWRSFNERFHEVMFAQAIARQRGAEFYTNRVHVPDPGPTSPNPQTIWLENA